MTPADLKVECPYDQPAESVCRENRRDYRLSGGKFCRPCASCGRILGAKPKEEKRAVIGHATDGSARASGGRPGRSIGKAPLRRIKSGEIRKRVLVSPGEETGKSKIGVVAERPKAAVLKTVDRKRSVGSTPTRSAKKRGDGEDTCNPPERRAESADRSRNLTEPGNSSESKPPSSPTKKRKHGRPTHYFKDGHPLLASSLGWDRHKSIRNPGLAFVVQRRERAA